MERFVFLEDLMKAHEESQLSNVVFADKVWQRKVQKPLIILWRIGIVLAILPFFYRWPKYQWVALVYILAFFLASYLIFLWKINRYAKIKSKEQGWETEKGFFKHWIKGLKRQSYMAFEEKLKNKLDIELNNISNESLDCLIVDINKKVVQTKKVFYVKFSTVLAIISIIVSFCTAAFSEQEDKIKFTIIAVSCLVLVWGFVIFWMKIIEDRLNVKNRKIKEIAEFFEDLKLTRLFMKKDK